MRTAQDQSSAQGDVFLRLLAEFRTLERQRTREGLTPHEYQRWLDLGDTLERDFGKRPEAEGMTRMRVRYRTQDHLMGSALPELPGGGLFVPTPFAPKVGTEIVLLIEVGEVEESEIPGIVVSNNVTEGFTTARLGMGVGFGDLDQDQGVWAERIGARKPAS